ncbi:EF-hand domain-containing protein [Novosphingobium beihaiensis]|uniref:Signal transduction protein n=1 Tax=Novosphingobium beihaiensis TaxID=2930389 RepID=A0ABT0BTG9_9SPHN|nr:signal transduction protein [Novosphingobium beihaiensis]MCJ2188334.1 signal transduction protein [Novosphingobium beihaiensis]
MAFSRTLALCLTLTALIPAIAQAATAEAASKAIESLRAADTDHDGAVTRAELTAYRDGQWPRFDRNSDGYFSQDDLPGLLRGRWNGDKLTKLRDTYDSDRDGRISRREFTTGPAPAFDKADADHDGRVTEAELKTALAAARN